MSHNQALQSCYCCQQSRLKSSVSASVSKAASISCCSSAECRSVSHTLHPCMCEPCRYVRSIAPKVHPPRWLVSIALNRFVDQDTYLLATQQSVTLSNELRDIADKQQPAKLQQPQASDAQASDRQRADGEAAQAGAPMARRSWYCHRSPTDNILVASGKWMDKAVPGMPNRYQGLLSSSLQGAHLDFGLGLVAAPIVSVRQWSSIFAAVGVHNIFQNGVCCIRLLILECLWALLMSSAEQQFCNATPARTLAVQIIAERSAVAFATSRAGLMAHRM